VNRKNRTGLWLSLATLLLAAVLVLSAFNRINFPSGDAAVMRTPDPFNLKFEKNCIDCHIVNLPDITWYCHDVLPTESYASRLYLEAHLYWITSTMLLPPNLFLPLVQQLPEDEFQIHLFDQTLFPVNANVTVGTTVTWTNLDIRNLTLESSGVTPHQGPFGRITLKPGESMSYTFDKVGVFTYKYLYIAFGTGTSGAGVTQAAVGKITITAQK
jgi:hypothetical protein